MISDPTTRETPLASKLKEQIRRNGPISVAAFFRACLQDPEHGYYVTRNAIGAEGDFITSPEISQVFGELLGLWSAVVWQQMGSPDKVNLIELGPGRGTLMSDALRATSHVPTLSKALSVHLVETSKPLAEAQRRALQTRASAMTWHNNIETVPKGPAIILANEFLDALPVNQCVFQKGEWLARTIGLNTDGGFVFVTGETASDASHPQSLTQPTPPPKDGDVFEHQTGARALLQALARSRDGNPWACLFVDYGHTEARMGDTMQGVKQHRHVSPFETPGETDLTIEVDFEQLARTCRDLGLAVDGPITQAEFLGRLGIIERASKLMHSNPEKAADIEASVARLMAPGGMGTRFKVLGVRSADLAPLPGLA